MSPFLAELLFYLQTGKIRRFSPSAFLRRIKQKEPLHFLVQRLLLFAMIRFYHSSYSPSAFLAAATRLRLNMLSTTAQYLSARQTMTASRQVGT